MKADFNIFEVIDFYLSLLQKPHFY